MPIQDLDVRIINAATGELSRQLTIDPMQVQSYSDVLTHRARLKVRARRDSNSQPSDP
jgi:hypothetical protein